MSGPFDQASRPCGRPSALERGRAASGSPVVLQAVSATPAVGVSVSEPTAEEFLSPLSETDSFEVVAVEPEEAELEETEHIWRSMLSLRIMWWSRWI